MTVEKIKAFFKKKQKTPQVIRTELHYDDEHYNPFFKEHCPSCGAFPVFAGFTCHTYGGEADGTGWKSCLPCDSARYLYCNNDNCDWSYTWGYNRNNPRFAHEELDRPDWLIGDRPQ